MVTTLLSFLGMVLSIVLSFWMVVAVLWLMQVLRLDVYKRQIRNCSEKVKTMKLWTLMWKFITELSLMTRKDVYKRQTLLGTLETKKDLHVLVMV